MERMQCSQIRTMERMHDSLRITIEFWNNEGWCAAGAIGERQWMKCAANIRAPLIQLNYGECAGPRILRPLSG